MFVTYDYDVTCVIMGGGQGTRLSPLTKDRAKPAVPLGAKYRLIDIPLSNCLNSGLNRIFILTQFNSTSLHRHIHRSYHFDRFARGWVEILAAQQTPQTSENSSWYQGTADAVRKNVIRLREARGKEVLILSGDQIYQMDYRDLLATHRGVRDGKSAPVTIAALLVDKERAGSLGIMQIDDDGYIKRFVEKPGNDEELLASLVAPDHLVEGFGLDAAAGPWFLANMGIYAFETGVLERALEGDTIDFGKEVLPDLLSHVPMRAHLFHGYWEDIGTIASFLQANLSLGKAIPEFNFYDPDHPVYTRARLLPATKIRSIQARNSLIAEGCIIEEAEVENSLVGIRSRLGRGVVLRSTFVMGSDIYESNKDLEHDEIEHIPPVGIGDGTVIENAIVDKNPRIGRNVSIRNEEKHDEFEDGVVYIRDGIAIVPRNGVVPDGYRI
jgi:glucose-1-phosphate adenylyltransferase